MYEHMYTYTATQQPEQLSSSVQQNPRYDTKYEYICYSLIFKTIQHVTNEDTVGLRN